MKKIICCLIIVVVTICAYAQKDVTKFLGIPVDGSKTELIQKLKAKGFRPNHDKESVLEGEFNGMNVNVFIATNGNKVCRIMVCDVNSVDERSIQIRFNNLCRQFEKNPNYMTLGYELIADDEDISYEINVNNKRYEAIFYQRPNELSDTTLLQERLKTMVLNKYSTEELANLTDEAKEDLKKMSLEYMMELCFKKPVWFIISELYGKYYITMFYDNEYNRANGEDL